MGPETENVVYGVDIAFQVLISILALRVSYDSEDARTTTLQCKICANHCAYSFEKLIFSCPSIMILLSIQDSPAYID